MPSSFGRKKPAGQRHQPQLLRAGLFGVKTCDTDSAAARAVRNALESIMHVAPSAVTPQAEPSEADQ